MTDTTAARLEAALNAQADLAAARPPAPAVQGEPHVGEPITIAPTPIRSSRRRPGVAIGAAVVGVAAIAAATIAFTDVGSTAGHGSRIATHAGGAPVTPSRTVPTPTVSAPAAPAPVGAQAGQTLLANAAAGRAAAGDPSLKPGQFLLQTTVSGPGGLIDADTGRTTKPPAGAYGLDRTWRPADQTDVWTRQQQTVGWPAMGRDLSRWSGVCDDLYQNTQDPPAGSGCGRPGGFDDISPAFVQSLPRDPSALYQQIRTYAQGEVNSEKVHNVDTLVVMTIDGLFYSDAVPADLASSLIKALAMVPSIHVVENVSTYKGRIGFGVQVTHVDGSGKHASPSTTGIILDPKTGAYLGDYSGRPGTKGFGSDDVTVSVVNRVH